MSHVHHESLPGYNPAQLLHDGCPECEQRGAQPAAALGHLDHERFLRAWARAAAWQRDRLPDDEELSVAEAPMLRSLWAVQVAFERHLGVPLGYLPAGGQTMSAFEMAERLKACLDV